MPTAPESVLPAVTGGGTPDDPVVILGEVSGGGSPSSPVIVLATVSGGGSPSSPVIVLATVSGGGSPTAPVVILGAVSGGGSPLSPHGVLASAAQEIRIQLAGFGTYSVPPYNAFYMSWAGQAELVFVAASISAAGGVVLTANVASVIAGNTTVTSRFSVEADGTEIVLTAIAGAVSGFLFTHRVSPLNAITVAGVSYGGGPPSPDPVLAAISGAVAPAAPRGVLMPATGWPGTVLDDGVGLADGTDGALSDGGY